MKWAKAQGAYTGYAHSASGLGVNPKFAARRNLDALDVNKDGQISRDEAAKGLLPEPFDRIDTNKDGVLTMDELVAANARAFQQLPNLAIPEMDGIGAQEICVTTAQGICDFISAMDTARIPEWNCWYHIMNCGFPLKVSGETDFPCISGSRVGQGRVSVGPRDAARVSSFFDGPHGGSHRRPRRRAGRRSRRARSADGQARTLRPAVRDSGGGVQVIRGQGSEGRVYKTIPSRPGSSRRPAAVTRRIRLSRS